MSEEREGFLIREPRTRDAAQWFVENDSDRVPNTQTLAQWEEWSVSDDNRAEYARIIRIYRETRSFAPPPPADREDLLDDVANEPDASVIQPKNFFPGSLAPRSQLSRSSWNWLISSRVRWLPGVAVVGVLLVCSIAAFLWLNRDLSYVTASGELREIVLPDGSHVTLGGDSRLTTRFTWRNRNVELDHGEAFFTVKHDAQRPFVVQAANGRTTAVGTAFEVRRYEDHVQVWVREGIVAIAPRNDRPAQALLDSAASSAVHVRQGEETKYDSNGQPAAPRPADPTVTAAWIEGHLVPLIYHGRPLAEVIADIQPFTGRKIIIDPAVAGLQYSGFVKQEDVDAWVRDLSAIFPVDVIDCLATRDRSFAPECADPRRLVIRKRLKPGNDLPLVAGL